MNLTNFSTVWLRLLCSPLSFYFLATCSTMLSTEEVLAMFMIDILDKFLVNVIIIIVIVNNATSYHKHNN